MNDRLQAQTQSGSQGSGGDVESKRDGMKDDLRGLGYDDQQRLLQPVEGEQVPEGPSPEEEEQKAKQRQSNFEAELKAQYDKQFGSKIGGKLYELVTDNLGPDALMKYAKQGVEAGLKAISGLADTEEAKAKLKEVWEPQTKELAAQIIDGNPAAQKILAGLSNFMREHPYGLLALALATAVAAGMKVYSDNIDLPELKGMVPLGKNVKAGASIDLGRIQELTVQSLHGYLEVHTSKFQMKLDVGHTAGENGEADQLGVDADASLTLLERSGKDIDETTKQLKREYSTKLSTTFGGSFRYNEQDWTLDALKLAWGIALEAKDKRLVSQSKLGELERSEYRETVLKLYANHLQQYRNVEGSLQPEEISLAMGLSLVVNKSVEIKSTDAQGNLQQYKLDPLKWGFNWGLNYKDRPLDLDGGQKIGTEAGIFVEKGNWSLGASVDYTHDMMRNQGGFGGKLTFSIKF